MQEIQTYSESLHPFRANKRSSKIYDTQLEFENIKRETYAEAGPVQRQYNSGDWYFQPCCRQLQWHENMAGWLKNICDSQSYLLNDHEKERQAVYISHSQL